MRRVDLVVMGASLGGFDATRTLLAALPSDLAPPVVLAQHRMSGTTDLCQLLGARSSLPVLEVEDQTPLDEGCIYVAPADYHVIVEAGRLSLSTEARVTFARPSIDVLFESAAYAYGASAVGVVLTGSSEDGAKGAEELCRRHGRVIVQDPQLSRSPVAPEATLARVRASFVGSEVELGQWLGEHCRRKIAPSARW